MQQRKVDWAASDESSETGFKEVNRICSDKSARVNRSQKLLDNGQSGSNGLVLGSVPTNALAVGGIERWSYVVYDFVQPLGCSTVSVRPEWKNGLNPKNETLGKGTLCRERNCKWQRNEWGGTRRNSAA